MATSPDKKQAVAGDGEMSKSADSLTLDRLVTHFVAAKRSLTSTTHAWQANDIVTKARQALQRIVVLESRNSFNARHISKQVVQAQALLQGLNALSSSVDHEFKQMLKDLDAVDARTKQAIQQLCSTAVDTNLRPAGEEQRTLHDFIDEQGLQDLTELVRECIDNTKEAHDDFRTSMETLGDGIQDIVEALDASFAKKGLGSPAQTAQLYRSLEADAADLADSVQSLVRHYDLCVTALKHTEGGGAAVERAMSDMPLDMPLHELEHEAPPQPMTEQDRAEMLQVLDNDAMQVEEVAQEVRDTAERMEVNVREIVAQSELLQNRDTDILDVDRTMAQLGEQMPQFVDASERFRSRWLEIRSRIQDHMGELEALQTFYAGFIRGYDALLLEIARRRAVQGRVFEIAKSAASAIEKLYDEDADERESFKSEHGQYLPVDIWPDLMREPAKANLMLPESIYTDVPSISKETLSRAMRRLGSI